MPEITRMSKIEFGSVESSSLKSGETVLVSFTVVSVVSGDVSFDDDVVSGVVSSDCDGNS